MVTRIGWKVDDRASMKLVALAMLASIAVYIPVEFIVPALAFNAGSELRAGMLFPAFFGMGISAYRLDRVPFWKNASIMFLLTIIATFILAFGLR